MFFEEEKIKVQPKPWMTTKKFVLVTEDNLQDCIDHCMKGASFSLDLETTGVNYDQFNGKTRDHIVGVCISPDGHTGYYIPVAHKYFKGNVPWEKVHAGLCSLMAAKKVAKFHNAIFDITFLEFNGLGPIGDFSKHQSFEDTMILAFLRNTKGRKGLKYLAENDLGMQMIELSELFPKDVSEYDFSTLDPTDEAVLWYAGSDAICTYLLFDKLYPEVCEPKIHSQKLVYALEKSTLYTTMIMEQNRVCVDIPKIRELIQIANQELLDTLNSVYTSLNLALGRDVRPAYIKMMLGSIPNMPGFNPSDMQTSYKEYVDKAKALARAQKLDVNGTLSKAVSDPQNRSETIIKEFPITYDVMSSSQLGDLFVELGIEVQYSEKGNIKTNAEELDRILEEVDESMDSLKDVGKLRSIIKALSTYLYPLLEDSVEGVNEDGETIYTVRAGFKQLGTETGRFAASTSKNPKKEGGTRFTFHGAPASGKGKPGNSTVLGRIRECVIPRRKSAMMVSIDFSGVELRIAASLSNEPKWKNEFFRCSTCGHEYERPAPGVTPNWIPAHCVKCGSDRIGDIHTLTGIAIYGEAAANGDPKEWKVLRGKAKCVTADTLIRTRKGLQPIADLRPSESLPDTFTPIDVDVMTERGWEKATYFYDGGFQQVYEVTTPFGRAITGTENHPVRVVVNGELVWKNLGQLEIGDEILDPYIPQNWEDDSNEDLYYQGMTWVINKGQLGRYLTEEHQMILAERGIETVMNRTLFLPDPEQEPYDLRNLPFHREFIAGFIEAHGNIRAQGRITFSEPTVEGIAAIKTVLSAYGIPAVYREESINGYIKYVLEIPKHVLRDLRPLIIERSLQYIKKGMAETNANSYILTHPVFRVRSVGQQRVWDLHIPGSHSFWSNGLISHNSTNFALAYGGSFNAVIRACAVSQAEAKRIKNKFDNTYSVLQNWWEQTKQFGRTHGYVVDAYNRRYPLPDINLPPYDKVTGQRNGGFIAQAERNAVNAPVQATSASITKAGMVFTHKLIVDRGWQSKVKMLMTIHDELVFEIDLDILEDAIDAIVEAMTRNPMVMSLKWDIPLTSDVEFGPNWSVPYNLYSLRKGEKAWPEYIAPYFKQKRFPYYTGPSEGNELRTFHLSDLTNSKTASEAAPDRIPVEAAPAPVEDVISEELHHQFNTASPVSFVVVSDTCVKMVIPRFDIGFLSDLAYVIERADGTGQKPLRFFTTEGVEITSEFYNSFHRTILVDPEVFKSLVKSRTFE